MTEEKKDKRLVTLGYVMKLQVDAYKDLLTSPWAFVHIIIAYLWFWKLPELAKFYWNDIFGGLTEFQVFVIGAWAVRCIPGFFGVLIFDFFEAYKFPWIEQYRLRRQSLNEENPQEWYKLKSECVKVLLVEYLVLIPFFLTCYYYLFNDRLPRMDGDSFPEPLEILGVFIFAQYFDVIWDSLFHRFLHLQPIYWIHKVHHKIYNTNAYASEYQHPIEFFIMHNTQWATVLLLGTQMHFYQVLFGYFMAKIGSLEEHSGYSFPYNPVVWLPFGVPTGYHDYHHIENVGNISGGYIIWDYVFGTCDVFFKEVYEKPDNSVVESPYRRLYKPLKND